MFSNIFILLAILISISEASDKFTFDLTITCRHTERPKFWYEVDFIENDTASPGDRMKKPYSEEIPTGTKKIQFIGSQDGDENFSKGYSISAIFEHDCTPERSRTKVNFRFTDFCKIGRDCTIRFDADLTDKQGLINAKARISYFA
ncbi:unnamed protein product [Caenorhabditis angaria]|uniref:Uncharacterized protein n=1 Tax=Caenorhabditis angaria TaxID=860376 RepID=A0A9P1MWB4_9PELO|nr:unnamed protein product [Caenorhabditis angaria]